MIRYTVRDHNGKLASTHFFRSAAGQSCRELNATANGETTYYVHTVHRTTN